LKDNQKRILELLDQHGESLHRLLSRLTRCEHSTSDLMQELFIRLCCARGFAKALNPYAYAWKTAANLAFEWRRKQKITFESLEAAVVSDESNRQTLEQMIEEEQLNRVLCVTSGFNELARNVIVMRFMEQKSYQQIAERLGKNPNHIRSLCSKTLERLRRIMNIEISVHVKKEVSNG
jgi:RNA polymerase sigma-70 factor (ECF subfamily)